MKKILIAVFLMGSMVVRAQSDSSKSPLSFSGYIETYYSYDFGNPANHTRPGFVYSFNRHNEINLNLGFVKVAYEKNNVRANLAIMTGSYANANLAAEPGVLKNIFEANAGVKLSKGKNLWLDAGIFASHIGFESAIGKDCWNLTRSILADNSPYYESGVKVSYTSADGKWFISGLILNGWQHIQRTDGNNTPAFGHQLTWKQNSKITLNSSSFIGNDKPDSMRQMRYFHNFYAIIQLNSKVGITAGFDIGAEQKAKHSKQFNCWYSPVLICRISPTAKSGIGARAEYYCDPNAVIISTGTPNGFKTWGYSLNFDYQVRENVLFRIEGRAFSGKDKTFVKDESPNNTNLFLTTSIAISF
ncbi:MAG: porin [Ferruginibacter sp.]